jgi:tetratricopeptide (TPR) repeat protein
VLAFAAPALGQSTPQAALLELVGWEALNAGQTRVAAEAFRDAIASDPKTARLYLGAATAAYRERRYADARQFLERALQLDPGLTLARGLLGQVLYRTGDLAGAIRSFETVTVEAPGDKEALATLERWRRELELRDRMQHAVGSYFDVFFEGPAEEQLAAQALELIERAYWRIGGILTMYPPSPVRVVLYTTEQFRDITRAPSWAVGAYDGTIRIPIRGALNDVRELERVLAHEFTHALVYTLAPRGVPSWLNEGLAAALEIEDLAWAEARVSQTAPVALSALQSSFGRLTGPEAQFAYATSAIAVRRLIDEVGGFSMALLLRDLGEGASFETAFQHRMQRSFADFEASLSAP